MSTLEADSKIQEVSLDEKPEEDGLDGDLEFAVMDEKDMFFDLCVGALEDFIMDDDFHGLREQFAGRHCHEFEVGEENKLSYMPVFEEWTETMEKALDAFLRARVPKFDMESFLKLCEERKEELADDLVEVLGSLTDFPCFKEFMLEQKMLQSRVDPVADLTQFLSVQSLSPTKAKPAAVAAAS